MADGNVVEKLVVQSLHLVDKAGVEVGLLSANQDGGCGLRLTGPQGHTVEITLTAEHAFVGLRRAGNLTADDIAIAIDKDGPFLQVVADKLYHIRSRDLIEKLAKLA